MCDTATCEGSGGKWCKRRCAGDSQSNIGIGERPPTLAGMGSPSHVIASGVPLFPCVEPIETYVIIRRRFRSCTESRRKLGPRSAPVLAAASERASPPGIRRCPPNHTKPAMSLVPYPDSDDGEDGKAASLAPQPSTARVTPAAKRKRSDADQLGPSELPPLPAAFHDLYSTNARTSTNDDPSLHGGRKRAVPHIEGNWPSHIFLECMHPRSLSLTMCSRAWLM